VNTIESEMCFGEYPDERYYRIENSTVHKLAGENIKSVEFIYYKDHDLIFLEAKSTCPHPDSKGSEDKEKARKYEEYFSDITDKFVDSLNMFSALKLGKYDYSDQVGQLIQKTSNFKRTTFVFILVIGKAEEGWLSGPKAELERRLLKINGIWKSRVLVLNASLAKRYGLIKNKL